MTVDANTLTGLLGLRLLVLLVKSHNEAEKISWT